MADKKKKGTQKKSDTQEKIEKVVRTSKKVKVRKKYRPLKAFVTIVICLAILLGALYVYRQQGRPGESPSLLSEGELRIHFVDVGQGDCIMIQLPDGKNMIIDGGDRGSDSVAAVNAYIDRLKGDAQKLTFDYLLLTHTDSDHVGGLDDVILREDVDVKKMFVPRLTTDQITTQVYRDFLSAIEQEKTVVEGVTVEYSTVDSDFENLEVGYRFDFVTPTDDCYDMGIFNSAEGKNSVSPIIVMEFGGKKVLFTGDANEKYTEKWFADLIAADTQHSLDYYDVDVLKVGHHGSETSTGAEFLEVVKPEYAVISYGEGNKYGHPREELLTRLRGYMPDSNIYRTAEDGTIVLSIRKDEAGVYGLFFTSENGHQSAALAAVLTIPRYEILPGRRQSRQRLTVYLMLNR